MSEEHIQTKRDVRAILDRAGARPQKRHGQNFLIDGNLMRKLVDSAEITSADTVLEVGGGTGGLTDLLAARAGRVVVVEIDRVLGPLLQERFAASDQVRILLADVLRGKNTINPAVLSELAAGGLVGGRTMLVANLPYNVATPLLMNLLTAGVRVERFCFTIQKEVAQRMTATPGGKDFGPLAIALQTTCTILPLAKLPPQAFWPAPQIESSMLRLDRQPHAFEQGDDLPQFFALLRAAFAHRRKTLRYNLIRHLDETHLERAREMLDLSARAETVPLETWIALATRLFADHEADRKPKTEPRP